jgi:hypothetical protein
MTLVPIIFTSLLIFSALFVFVIIISFISFKIKSYDKHESKNRAQFRMQPLPIKAPTLKMNSYSEGNNSVITNNYLPPKAITNYPDPKDFRTAQVPRFSNTQISRSEENRLNFSKTQRREDKKRIEIIKTSEKYYSAHNSDNNRNSLRSTNNLNDYSFLNYYTDLEDTPLVSLSTPGYGRM